MAITINSRRAGTPKAPGRTTDVVPPPRTKLPARDTSGSASAGGIAAVGEPLRDLDVSSAQAAWPDAGGPIVVEGEIDQVPGIAGTRDRILLLQPSAQERGRTAVPPPPPPPAEGTHPVLPRPTMPAALTTTVNGQLVPDVDIQPGEIQRWRVLNAERHREMWLHVEGHALHQIGQDGIAFSHTRPAQSIMLSPGNRAELLVRATTRGRYRVYAEAYDAGHPEGRQPTILLATMVVEGRAVFNRLPRQLAEPPFIPVGPVATRRKLHVRGAKSGQDAREVHLLADGRPIESGRLGTLAAPGSVEEWTLVNDDAVQHTIHIQGRPFQVIDIEGVPAGDPSWQTDPEIWWDTYRLPPNGQATIRLSARR